LGNPSKTSSPGFQIFSPNSSLQNRLKSKSVPVKRQLSSDGSLTQTKLINELIINE
jgi:hypothetical protein